MMSFLHILTGGTVSSWGEREEIGRTPYARRTSRSLRRVQEDIHDRQEMLHRPDALKSEETGAFISAPQSTPWPANPESPPQSPRHRAGVSQEGFRE